MSEQKGHETSAWYNDLDNKVVKHNLFHGWYIILILSI